MSPRASPYPTHPCSACTLGAFSPWNTLCVFAGDTRQESVGEKGNGSGEISVCVQVRPQLPLPCPRIHHAPHVHELMLLVLMALVWSWLSTLENQLHLSAPSSPHLWNNNNSTYFIGRRGGWWGWNVSHMQILQQLRWLFPIFYTMGWLED